MSKLGDIKTVKEWNRCVKYIYLACKECGKKRWRRFYETQKKKFNGLCVKCHSKKNHKKMVGKPSCNWKGGCVKHGGYNWVFLKKDDPYYPMINNGGYVLEHRLVVAKHLGRCLERWEIVHHKNRIKDDNRIENLELLPNQSSHVSLQEMGLEIEKLKQKVFELENANRVLEERLNKKQFVTLDFPISNVGYCSVNKTKLEQQCI